jgi:hypothetical protein
MASMVLNLQSIHFENINIKKPITYHEMTSNDVYYEDKPFLIMIKGLQIFQKAKNIKCVDTCQSLDILETLLFNMVQRVKTNKNYGHLFSKKEYYTMFESNNTVNFKNVCSYDTSAFDVENNKIDIERMKRGDNVSIVVYLKNIWINAKYYGMNMKICQIQRNEPLGLNKSLFNTNIPSLIPPPPSQIPPPPPPPISIHTPIKLNKNQNRQNITTPQIKTVRPSLYDILNSRGKLRKTNILC